MTDVVVGVHGGTGMPRSQVTPELDRQLREGLKAALEAGFRALLKEGSTSLDAVEAAVRKLEDDPLFNAGKGSVFTREGTIELDAAVMEGSRKRAGAVAAVTTLRNPVSAARGVMERSPHVLLVGRGAEKFAADAGLQIVDPTYFHTDRRRQELQRLIERQAPKGESAGESKSNEHGNEHGTVGAVAVDGAGNLAAATSTGGMNGKASGRIGDSPLIGAGTWAENASCAVSATGHGEFFIRWCVAHEIAARMKLGGASVERAADAVMHGEMKEAGGRGGVIALDARGRFAMSWNTEGLYRGYITKDGKATVLLYED